MCVKTNKKMIPGILELSSRTKYGLTSRNVPLHLFRPLNSKLSLCIVGCSQVSSTNVLALVEVLSWNPEKLTRGLLSRIIGPCGDFEAEREALVMQYSPIKWKKNIKINIPSNEDRFRIQGISLNIDPPGCEDIDDVLTIGDDGFYYITIADVAEWMKANPAMFANAHRNGQTLYENGKVVRPMLPFQTECSLKPQQLRLGVSLRFRIVDNAVADVSFLKTVIINDTSYSYNEIQTSVYALELRNLTTIITGKDTWDSYKWVEALMIFYNTESAKILKTKCQGILRAHDAPDFEIVVASSSNSVVRASPSLNKLEKYRSLGVSAEILAMKSAKYVPASATSAVHWGLQTDVYCHATSPIRRFADIVNQFVLKGDEVPEFDIDMLNEREKDLRQYERDMFFLGELESAIVSCVSGIILTNHRVWVPDWKRIVTYKNEFSEGTKGTLHFSLDMNQSTWKRRMVFRFVDSGFMD